MNKLSDLSPALTALIGGAAGAVLTALNDLMGTGQPLTGDVVLHTALNALVGYLLAFGLGYFHLLQTAPKDKPQIMVGQAPAAVPVPIEDKGDGPTS